MSRLALGTVQFGMDYGINNQRGKVSREEVFAILDEAAAAGIDLLDTAYGYGESETVIGEYLRGKQRGFRIVSKLPKCRVEEAPNYLTETLLRLGQTSLYGYIFHDFDTFRSQPAIFDWFTEQKSSGKIAKIGFSLYYPAELRYLLENRVEFDLIQFPYSIFDQQFASYLPVLKNQGVEVHVRSVFLQGLVFKKPAELTGNFIKIREKMEKLHSVSEHSGISVLDLCLGYVVANSMIDKVIVGVDSLNNFINLIDFQSNVSVAPSIYRELGLLREEDEEIILPFNWASN